MAQNNPVEVQKHLKGADYPMTKNELLDLAEQDGADERTLDLLNQLPEKTYEKPTQVTEELSSLM